MKFSFALFFLFTYNLFFAQTEVLILKRSLIAYQDRTMLIGNMLSTGDTIYYMPSQSKVIQLTNNGKLYYSLKTDIEKSMISDGSPIVQKKVNPYINNLNNVNSNYHKSGNLIKNGALSMLAGIAIAGIGTYVGIEQNNDNIVLGSTLLGGGLSMIGLINIARGGHYLSISQ